MTKDLVQETYDYLCKRYLERKNTTIDELDSETQDKLMSQAKRICSSYKGKRNEKETPSILPDNSF